MLLIKKRFEDLYKRIEELEEQVFNQAEKREQIYREYYADLWETVSPKRKLQEPISRIERLEQKLAVTLEHLHLRVEWHESEPVKEYLAKTDSKKAGRPKGSRNKKK